MSTKFKRFQIMTASLVLSTGFLLPLSPSAQTNYITAADMAAKPHALLASRAVEQLYITNNGALLWKDHANVTALITALEKLERHGLKSEDYHLEILKSSNLQPQDIDRLATDAWLSAAAHMLYGKVDPRSVEPDWTAASRKADLSAILQLALKTSSVEQSLESLAPKQPEYRHLLDAYDQYRQQSSKPVIMIDLGDALKPNMTNPRVQKLQMRLIQLELLLGNQISGVMDDVTVTAVKTFQNSVNLDDDGVVGTATLNALNRGPQQKLDQLRVNLERWRWLPDDLGRRHLKANIADFNVTAFENGTAQRTHLTIVGKAYRKTPVFSDEIEYIVFNPWWETPRSLAIRDKLPTFRKDPGAVKRLGFEIIDSNNAQIDPNTVEWNTLSASNFPYRLRQKPGEMNALGQVKIMFPNQHNVYLHDTPTRGLFASRQRAFSSGCMRTQDPLDLSEWLLKETPGWGRDKIDLSVSSKRETRVTLSSKIPVHILYFTVIGEPTGEVRYLDDIYDRDNAVLRSLNATPS